MCSMWEDRKYLLTTSEFISVVQREDNRDVIVNPCNYVIDKYMEEREEYRFDPFYIVSDKDRYYLLGGYEKHRIQLEPRRI